MLAAILSGVFCAWSIAMRMASARPGIVCNHCYHSFALVDVGIRSADLEMLPDPFPLKCPRCGDSSSYSKTSIGRIVSDGIFKGS